MEGLEKEGLLEAARLMALSARTAPKARGRDHLRIRLLEGEEKERLAVKMEEMAGQYEFFRRDARNVREAGAVLLVGLAGEPLDLNCGACGRNCEEMRREGKKEGRGCAGPTCVVDALNLGIALGSAAKTASLLNVDNRMMFSAGVAARKAGLMQADVVIALPLSASGKSPFFDRPQP
ncbi:MAG: DUF2148 domain-containing protein [Candidatus Hadarchaeales archaeon]